MNSHIFEHLQADLESMFPGLKSRLALGKSGAAMMHCWWHGSFWVMEYRPNEGFGLDKDIGDDESFIPGYKNVYPDEQAFKAALFQQLKEVEASALSANIHAAK